MRLLRSFQVAKKTKDQLIKKDLHSYSHQPENQAPEINYYQTIFTQSKDALLILKNRIFIDCNDAALEMIGYPSKSQFISAKPSDISPPKQNDGKASFEKAQEMMDLAVKFGSYRFEWIHLKADGSIFPVEVLLTTISSEPGNEIIYTTWRDITDIQHYITQIAQSEIRFKSLMQQSPFIIEIYNLEGLQIEVNKAYEEMWGFPAETTVNKFNLLESDEVKRTGLYEYVIRAYYGEAVFVPIYEFNPRGKTEADGKGRNRWLSTKIYPLVDKDNNVLNIVITHEDVSEQQRVLQDLKFSEDKFRSLVETISDFIWEVDTDGIYTYVSPQVKRILGYEPEEMIGKTPFDFMPENEKKIISKKFQNLLENKMNV
jgi:PAS domain S-box-containing protein